MFKYNKYYFVSIFKAGIILSKISETNEKETIEIAHFNREISFMPNLTLFDNNEDIDKEILNKFERDCWKYMSIESE